jgi:phosphohistidine swiveling domain-containing protein
LILRFDEIEPGQLARVGGKGLNLGRLTRAGLPVPPGFVVTTQAYAQREERGLDSAILEVYRQFGAGPVAVRSSATAEDLKGASFAGQQESYLNVEGDDALLAAVRDCWDSLFTERAIAYRRAQGIAEEAVAMAVVVQRMVPAEAAGVLFTRDPMDPSAPRMLVEAVPGLGEALVSGSVTPDRWTLDARTGEVLETVPAPGGAPSGVTETDLHRLAELGRRVEAEYGAPQDVEWALADGALALLQSRPVTAGAGREQVRQEEIAYLRERAEPGGTVWARYSLAEVLPEPLPLTWALWRQFMSAGGGYGRMYRELGYDPDPCLDRDGVLDLIAGRPYFNLSRDAKLYFRNYPFDYPFEKLKANPERAIYPTPEPNLAKAPRGFLLKLPGVMRQMFAAEKTLERAAAEVPETLAQEAFPRLERLAAEWRGRNLTALSERELCAAFAETRAVLFDDLAAQTLKPGVLAGLAIQKLTALLKPALGEEKAASAVDALLAGAATELEHDLAAALRSLAHGTLTQAVFVERFGHRGSGEMELAQPRWREAPPLLTIAAQSNVGASERASLERLLAGTRVNPKQASLYLERARRFTALRETAKHFLMMGYEVLRLLLLELDQRQGLEGGVFYLEPEELDSLAAGADLRPRIAARRKRRSLALGLEAPRVLFSDDLEAIGRSISPAGTGEALRGTGVSAGVAEGEALVLRRPEDAPAAARDFVLVCPSTDPGWVPLFVRARAVVLETGGVLSHGAIVAREFGLPAVANIEGACLRFRTGQRLRVDGGQGVVWPVPPTG